MIPTGTVDEGIGTDSAVVFIGVVDEAVAVDGAWVFKAAENIHFPAGQFVQLEKIVDHVTFPRCVGEYVRNDFAFNGVRYTNVFPTEESEVPCIVYRLIRRIPGMEGVETRKPRLRFVYQNDDGTINQVFGQWMTCIFQWDCCALSTVEAEELVENLDSLLHSSVGTFLNLGVSEMVFEEQLEDNLLQRSDNIKIRSLRWLVRTERREVKTSPTINSMRVTCFFPQEETYEQLTRNSSILDPDVLATTHISNIIVVSDPSPSGIARTQDYILGVDFEYFYDPVTQRTFIVWLEPGKRPEPGAVYYVRFNHWTAFSTLHLPLSGKKPIFLR